MQVLRKLGSLQGVAAGATVNFRLPKEGALEALFLEYAENGTAANATTMANLTEITAEVNGVQILNVTGAQIHALNSFHDAYKGVGFIAGWLPVFHARPNWWLMGDYGQLLLDVTRYNSVDFKVKIASGVTSPTLSAWALWAAPVKIAKPRLYVLRKHAFAPAATGEFTIGTEVLKRQSDVLLALHATRANIDQALIQAGGVTIHESSGDSARKALLYGYGKSWQSGYTHFDLARLGTIGEGMRLNIQDLQVKLTLVSATTAFDLLQERIEPAPV